MKQEINLENQIVSIANILNAIPPKTTLIHCSDEVFEALKLDAETFLNYGQAVAYFVAERSCIRTHKNNDTINIIRKRGMKNNWIEATFTEDPKEVELLEDPSLEDARQLLNYAAKQLEKFQLTSAEISVTIEDIKYEVKVTK